MEKPFWLVWNPNGHTPSRKHDTEALAIEEASRLAELNPTEKFFVLEATVLTKKAPSVYITAIGERAAKLDDIPF